MQRRHLLQSATAAALAWTAVGRTAFAATSPTGSAPLPGNKRLIVVFLRGAVDGLSVVVPYSEGAYYRERSTIALERPGQDGGVFDLDGHFGLNPNLAPLMPRVTPACASACTTTGGSAPSNRLSQPSGVPLRPGVPDSM